MSGVDRYHTVSVLCLGDVMLDRFVHGAVARISPEGPVPVMSSERTQALPGGAANVARNVAALGGRCTLIGVAGNDSAGEELRSALAVTHGVKAHLIPAARITTVKTRFVVQGQQLLRVDAENREPLPAEACEAVLAALEANLAEHQVLVLSDYAKGLLTPELIACAMAMARTRHVPVIVDPKTADMARYAGATVVTPNAKEAELATGEDPTEDDSRAVAVGQRMLELGGIESVLITRAHRGMTLVSRTGEPVHLRAHARDVFDVVGAGDTVVATLALAVGAGETLAAAAHVANAAAGIVVGKRGTACVAPDELQAELSRIDRKRQPDVGPGYSTDQTLAAVARWRGLGLRLGVVVGRFTRLTPADLRFLHAVRHGCDRLMAIVESHEDAADADAEASVVPASERAELLAALDVIDGVMIAELPLDAGLLRKLAPDVYGEADRVGSRASEIAEILPLLDCRHVSAGATPLLTGQPVEVRT